MEKIDVTTIDPVFFLLAEEEYGANRIDPALMAKVKALSVDDSTIQKDYIRERAIALMAAAVEVHKEEKAIERSQTIKAAKTKTRDVIANLVGLGTMFTILLALHERQGLVAFFALMGGIFLYVLIAPKKESLPQTSAPTMQVDPKPERQQTGSTETAPATEDNFATYLIVFGVFIGGLILVFIANQ